MHQKQDHVTDLIQILIFDIVYLVFIDVIVFFLFCLLSFNFNFHPYIMKALQQ